jgi:RNA polymerase sigma-70 factor (ECF subfamily)
MNKQTHSADSGDWKAVMKEIQGGDQTAYLHFFQYYSPRLRFYVNKHVHDEQIAQEIVQETMTRVWQKAAQFDPQKSSPSTWVYTIARNLCFDMLRKQGGKECSLDSDTIYQYDDVDKSDAAVLYAPEHAMMQSKVREWLKVLPNNQKEIVSAVYLEDLSQKEVAERLNLPLGTVKSRLRLAIDKLRASIKVDL